MSRYRRAERQRHASFILGLIQSDAWRTDILRAVRALNLKDRAIGAGFIRATVWDYQHGVTDQSPLADIDVVHCAPPASTRAGTTN